MIEGGQWKGKGEGRKKKKILGREKRNKGRRMKTREKCKKNMHAKRVEVKMSGT